MRFKWLKESLQSSASNHGYPNKLLISFWQLFHSFSTTFWWFTVSSGQSKCKDCDKQSCQFCRKTSMALDSSTSPSSCVLTGQFTVNLLHAWPEEAKLKWTFEILFITFNIPTECWNFLGKSLWPQVPQAIWEIRPCDLWSLCNGKIIRICMGKTCLSSI